MILVFAICGVVATSLAQIFTSTYQKSLDCNAMQLLYHTSPLIGAVRVVQCHVCPHMPTLVCPDRYFLTVILSQGMLIMCPFFDDVGALVKHEYTPGCVFRIGNFISF